MFGIGFLSVLAQLTLLREMLVVFHGDELSFGAIGREGLFGQGLSTQAHHHNYRC
jgi:hypothetical protein